MVKIKMFRNTFDQLCLFDYLYIYMCTYRSYDKFEIFLSKLFNLSAYIYTFIFVYISHFSHFAQSVNTSGRDKTVINFNQYIYIADRLWERYTRVLRGKYRLQQVWSDLRLVKGNRNWQVLPDRCLVRLIMI